MQKDAVFRLSEKSYKWIGIILITIGLKGNQLFINENIGIIDKK